MVSYLAANTYTHLTTNELVMIEAYYQEGKKVCAIAKSFGRARQTIYNVISFLKTGHSAYDYYQRYKAKERHCGRQKTQLTKPIHEFIQSYLASDWSLDVIKGAHPYKIPCSMRTLYRLADRDIFKKEDMPWQGKRKPNGKKERRGKQAYRRDLRERADVYPNFETEF
uniref:helix-turn-helix domain-containing protein n=1 Tax=Streptococcus parasuis TaxID=1501662 RepID=UPI0028979EE7